LSVQARPPAYPIDNIQVRTIHCQNHPGYGVAWFRHIPGIHRCFEHRDLIADFPDYAHEHDSTNKEKKRLQLGIDFNDSFLNAR
jgi:hypothetical protein